MKINNFISIALVILTILIPELALAQTTGGGGSAVLANLVANEKFKMAMDMGLIIFAGYQWFLYFNGFDPSKAFKDAIVPAVITWFAFQWPTALSWIGLV